jgi:hypothetical protein
LKRGERLGSKSKEGWEAGRRWVMSEDRWKNLEVWQVADALAFRVYQETRNFSKRDKISP